MNLPSTIIKAIYTEDCISTYKGNSLIEALPTVMNFQKTKKGLTGEIEFNPKDIYLDGHFRAHTIAQLLDGFFQPLKNHIQLEQKISIMIRQGYVGRSLDDGSLNLHLQNGYERIKTGDLEVFRFSNAKSTARSLSLIGCSGSGKSTTLNRILSTYPQAIYHEKYNFTQITYLKIDCPHDGSLRNLGQHFFREIDTILKTNYEAKFAKKGCSVDALLANMTQIASAHAIGVLVIDEIQHLSKRKSGGVEIMLNFFVTLINTIGLPVVLVGTPMARPIFEMNLRSARRGAGFGALFWEPMKNPPPAFDHTSGKIQRTEWIAFTDKLWTYQWLQKRDETLSDDIRNCWYDLSQGVLDIVVKIFVLAQLRAITTRTERITKKLLQQVYDDELIPVHPMLAALRSGDPELISKYSDLTIPDFDKVVLKLSEEIKNVQGDVNNELGKFSGNPQAKRLYNLLVGMDCNPDLIAPLVDRVFIEHPKLTVIELMPIVLEWYSNPENKLNQPVVKKTNKSIKLNEWNTLDTADLRFQFSQHNTTSSSYEIFKQSKAIFDVDSWLKMAS